MIKEITIERLKKFSHDDAVGIGKLGPSLSARFDDSPMGDEMLRKIVESPSHAQIVARDETGKIVGAVTMNTVYAPFAGRIGYLEEIVVDADTQGGGIGGKLWDAAVAWAREQGLDRIEFTSRKDRAATHAFYEKRGAFVRESNPYRFELE
ncbi:GNAT family N-acetyltransferase [Candidatus Saccharibacteria bacterium]|nr:GNAT family N-acetyltransferase [Candidatus Saccharibacteria bacterium]